MYPTYLLLPTDQKTTAAKAVACLVLVGDQCRPEVARPGQGELVG